MFIKRIIAAVMVVVPAVMTMVSDGRTDSGRNLVLVDRALSRSLQDLKDSMASVDQSVQALRNENDSYQRKIESMKNALGRLEPNPDIHVVRKEDDPVSFQAGVDRLTEAALTRKLEEYRALNMEYEDLRRRVNAKEASLSGFQRSAAALQNKTGDLRNRVAAISEFAAEPFMDPIQSLERSYRESRKDLVLKQKQKEIFGLKPETVQAVSDSEVANRKLWSEMQSLESELKGLSAQLAQAGLDQSARREAHAGEMSGLESEMRKIEERKRMLEKEMDDIALPSDVEASDDKALKSYHLKLKRKNQWLRSRVASLNDFLPDF